MLLLNIGWMKFYQGNTINDKLKGGGKNVKKYNVGVEQYNFLNRNNKYYGDVGGLNKINLSNLNEDNSKNSINKCIIIWVAKNPYLKKTVIIGWYKNAKIFKETQYLNFNGKFSFKFVSSIKNSFLLPIDERIFQIPRGKGYFGQKNVYYGNSSGGTELKLKILQYLKNRKVEIPNISKNINNNFKARQLDIEKKFKIEKIAIMKSIEYFQNLGYIVNSVENEKKGWDLEAKNNDNLLYLEVKGLSGSKLNIELTPNEYYNMKKYKNQYRICILLNALQINSILEVFSFSFERNKWVYNNKILKIEEKIGAKFSEQ